MVPEVSYESAHFVEHHNNAPTSELISVGLLKSEDSLQAQFIVHRFFNFEPYTTEVSPG